jgi:hypothetical protein
MEIGDDCDSTSTNNNKHCIHSSLTMQKALETAYDDWNKSKMKDDYLHEINNEDDVVTSKQTETTSKNEIDLNTQVSPSISDDVQILATVETSEKENVVNVKQKSNITPPIVPATTTSIAYHFGNPSIDLIRGIIHIYKDM